MGNKRMSEEGLKRLEALKITPGPWVCEMVSNDDASWVVGTAVDANDNPVAGIVEREQAETITPDVAVCESLTPDRENGLLIAVAPDLLAALRAERETVEYLRRVAEQAAKYKYGFRLPTPIIQGAHDFFNGDCETDDEFAERVERHLPYGEATVYANDIYECWRPVSAPDLARFLREQQGEGEKG